MPPNGPRVRNACENCHKRKIRCLLVPGKEACQNCSASGSQCLFAPRVKTGRPRLSRTGSSPGQSQLPHNAFETLLQLQAETTHFLQDRDPTTSTLLNGPRQNSTPVLEEPPNLHQAPLQGMQDLRPLSQQAVGTQDYTTTSDDGGSASTTLMLPDSLLDLWNPLSTLTPPLSMPSIVASPVPSAASNLAEGPEPNLDFSICLQLCTRLDRHCRHLRDADHSLESLNDVLSTIGPACTAAGKTVSSTSASMLAASALVLAGVYKVFQICELIIGHASGGAPIPEVPTIDHLLLLKRLDLALLHGRDFLTRTGRPEAASKASQLHCGLETLVKQQDRWWD